MAERELTGGQLPFSNIAIPNFRGFFLGDFISERMRFLDHFWVQLLVRTTHAIICTSILMHQAFAVLEWLDPPGYLAVDGVNSFEATLQEMC
jgi:hypothetical protein